MSNSSPQPPPATQVIMTLAALASTGSTVRPSGETTKEQEGRILSGISTQLANKSLATGGKWQARGVGLTQDRANLAYIAELTAPGSNPACAVCLRGTVAGSPIDSAEDMEVGTMLPFCS